MAANAAKQLVYHQTRKNLMIGNETRLIIQVNRFFLQEKNQQSK